MMPSSTRRSRSARRFGRAIADQARAGPGGDRRVPGAVDIAGAAQRHHVPVGGAGRRRVARQLLRACARRAGGTRPSAARAAACRPAARRRCPTIRAALRPARGSAAVALLERALEDRGRGAEVVLEKQRLAQRQQQLDLIARIQASGADRVRAPRARRSDRTDRPARDSARDARGPGRSPPRRRVSANAARRVAAAMASSNWRWL